MDVTSFILGFKKGAASGTGEGSGGGGSVDAGLYMKGYSYNLPKNFRGKLYELGEKTYLLMADYAAGDTCSWYELVDGKFVVASANASLECQCVNYRPCVLNGKEHFFWPDRKRHVSFDLTDFTITEHTQPPANVDMGTYCVYNNALWVYCYADRGLYEWDEVNDTYSLRADLSSTPATYCYPFSINGDLYIISKTTVYRYENGTILSVGVLEKSAPSGHIGVKGNCYYYIGGSYDFRKYDVSTNQDIFLGRAPDITDVSACYSTKQDDLPKVCFHSNGKLSFCVELIEVEVDG